MFGMGYSRASGEVERRLRSLEQLSERDGGRGSARAGAAADQIAETVASVVNGIAERFRGGTGSMSDEASKFGNEAARLGGDALRRLSKEVAQRPLITLGVAIAVGLLVGLASHRR
jgi:ElaB/YqjD/DUF883 family membrane-anchored ribosome-binding protein